MIDPSFAMLLIVPMLLLFAALVFLPLYLSYQHKKTMDILLGNQALFRSQLEADRKRDRDIKLAGLQLQAYERMTLFLERIRLTNLLTRLSLPGQKAGNLYQQLLQAIREEYEHNMSQQLYISNATWDLIKSAREEVIRLINTAGSKVDKDAEATELAKELLGIEPNAESDPLERAMKALKQDMKDTF